ncbi:MAG: hypothetical protein HZB65_05055 [Candidatus Aenigmarchaeota archaeon]|nr:hypothetical protein [Candidatus Aenigmarchaeota archaeon]
MSEYTGIITENQNMTKDVYILRILLDNELGHRAGQFVNIEADIDDEKRIKAYSIASPCNQKKSIELCIKKIPGGKMSNYLYNLPIGSKLKITGPYGLFVVEDCKNNCIFVATGTGIAGIKPIIQDLLSRNCRKNIMLVYGVRKEEDIYYKHVFETLAKQYPNFSFVTTLSRPRTEWKGMKGYVQDWIKNNVKYTNQDVYVCGLPDMVEGVASVCKGLGFTDSHIHTEKYV